MIEETIKEYGDKIGMADLEFNENGLIDLSIEDIGDLSFVNTDPKLTVYLKKEYEDISLKIMEKALTICHYRQNNPFRVAVGTFEDTYLIFTISLIRDELSTTTIEKAIDFLHNCHRQIDDLDKK